MTNELKPCPCCGGKAGLYDTFRHYVVQCNECGLTTLKMIDEQEAIEVWNRRYERTCKIDGRDRCPECGSYLVGICKEESIIDEAKRKELHAALRRLAKSLKKARGAYDAYENALGEAAEKLRHDMEIRGLDEKSRNRRFRSEIGK